jgi:predicted DNA-binding transcriptional regulator AlpA
VQLSLLFSAPVVADEPKASSSRTPTAVSARPLSLDCLTTREVLRVVNVNRSTLFRWVRAKRFPQKHKSGGWLRSDVEKWLTEHEGENR